MLQNMTSDQGLSIGINTENSLQNEPAQEIMALFILRKLII